MTRAADLAKLIAGSSTLGGTGELVLKDVDTADGSSPKITFQTGDTDIAQDDVLGTIDFQAPDEGTGTDAILVSAGVEAKAEGDFSSSSNATSLVFKTGSSATAEERVRLTSAGRLGIGTTSPSYQLQVNGAVDILNVKGSTGNAFARFTDSDASADFSIGVDDGSGVGAGAFILYDRNNSAYRLQVDASGNVTIGDGNLVLASGHGIDFSATSDAGVSTPSELLDDYEEGTWTPTLGGNTTYHNQSGKYTKIGRTVHVTCTVQPNSLGTGSTTVVSGFPFATSTAQSGGYASGSIGFHYLLAVSVLTLEMSIGHGVTATSFTGKTSASQTVSSALAIFGDGARVDFSITYETA